MTEKEKCQHLDDALKAIVTEKTAMILALTKVLLPETKEADDAWDALDNEVERAAIQANRDESDEINIKLTSKTMAVLIFKLSLAKDVLVAITAVQRFKDSKGKEAT